MYNEITGENLDINVMDTNVSGELDVYGRLRAFGSQVDFSESPSFSANSRSSERGNKQSLCGHCSECRDSRE